MYLWAAGPIVFFPVSPRLETPENIEKIKVCPTNLSTYCIYRKNVWKWRILEDFQHLIRNNKKSSDTIFTIFWGFNIPYLAYLGRVLAVLKKFVKNPNE